jgi:outer membrane lipoprotein-sorting protein
MIDVSWQTTSAKMKQFNRPLFQRLTLVASLALILASCVPAPMPPQPILNEQILLQRLQANASVFSSLRGMTRIRTEDANGSVSARQVLLLAKPNSIRSEVLGPFGQPLLLLAARDGELRISLPREQRFLQGAATPQRIARFTRAALTAEQLVRLALYDVPLIAYSDSVLTHHDQGYRLLLHGEDSRRQQLDFDASGRLLTATYLRGEDPLLKVVYDRFEDDWQGFPRQVSVTMPEQAASFSLSYSDVELNPELAAEHFTLQPPVGVVTEALP